MKKIDLQRGAHVLAAMIGWYVVLSLGHVVPAMVSGWWVPVIALATVILWLWSFTAVSADLQQVVDRLAASRGTLSIAERRKREIRAAKWICIPYCVIYLPVLLMLLAGFLNG